jgi:hypothetical protein
MDIAGMLCCLLSASQTQAIIITDRWTDDLNFIAGVDQDDANQVLTILEDYNEDNLVLYASPTGLVPSSQAVVDNDPGEPVRYFDKIFGLQGESGNWFFDFAVTNTSPYQWSDYHLELWDATFENQLNDILVSGVLGPSSPFPTIAVMQDPDIVWYFDSTRCNDPRFCQDPGETFTYRLEFDLTAVQNSHNGAFGVRQLATVPEPTAAALIALGLAGVGFMRRRISYV